MTSVIEPVIEPLIEQASSSRPRQIGQWYRDAVSCLQSTTASLYLEAGADPLEVLGLGWRFHHVPGDVTPEEFYWACRVPGDPIASLLPHHDVTSVWRRETGADPLAALETTLADGRLPVVAVDNYHLPFRPAYHDVHSAHLIVVVDIDRERGLVRVSDAMPPAFQGVLPTADLLTSWTSANPRENDAFFSGARIGGRWLDVTIGARPRPLDPDAVATALRADHADFHRPDVPGAGLAGLDRFGAEAVAAAHAGERRTVEEIYTFGWGPQAQAAVHGELLMALGARWAVAELAEAGRRVQQVAHAWTPVRVGCAHGRDDAVAWAGPLTDDLGRLRAAHERALAATARAAAVLDGGPAS